MIGSLKEGAMRRWVIMVTVVATIGLGAGAASAAVGSTVSIRYNTTTERFHGAVSSSNGECEAGRLVKVFKKTADGRALQGKARTSAKGAWRLTVMHAHGHYFAVAPKAKAMHTTCARDRSKTVDVM